jgi:uncharacterized membrane protein YkvA (DUF1232 family)
MRMWGRFLKAVLKGEWKISPLSWLAVVGTIVYVVSPIDFIPDVIPFVGVIDDVGLWGVMSILAAREKLHWESSLRDGSITL